MAILGVYKDKSRISKAFSSCNAWFVDSVKKNGRAHALDTGRGESYTKKKVVLYFCYAGYHLSLPHHPVWSSIRVVYVLYIEIV